MKEETTQNPITIGDVLKDADFQNILGKRIWALGKYVSREYKSNPVKTLDNKRMLKVEDFIQQFVLILEKSCELSSTERNLINTEVQQAMIEWQIKRQKANGRVIEQGVPDSGAIA
ncbi:MAG: hypothetical protein LLG05_07835 [Porphyromonadaceae bacterium]|nr:hypothetical protein [Porphyromonadaceae bacterium]